MSKYEFRELGILTLLLAFAENNYFKSASDDLKKVLDEGLQRYAHYQGDTMLKSELAKINKFFTFLEKEIIKYRYALSNTFMLSVILGVTAHYSEILKNPMKVEVWEQINKVAESKLSKNYLAYEMEIEKAEVITDLMLGYQF